MKKIINYLFFLCFTVTVLVQSPANSKELGNLKTFKFDKNAIEIISENNDKIVLTVIKPNVIRIHAGKDLTLTEANNKKANIVLDSHSKHVDFKVLNKQDYWQIKTVAMSLRIYLSPIRFEAYKADNKTPYFKELKPLYLSDNLSVQTLTSSLKESYFGGGQQNGQYQFNGKNMDISYSGGWEEGDRPSPAPFYMSNNGYGVLRNTWSNGRYDFRSDDYLTSEHHENRFDAYYFFGESIKQVLAEYTAMTGRAPLIPRWAFEYGDADCYNDGDNVKKPGTVPQGWKDGKTGTTPDVITSIAAKYRQHDMPGGWILPNDGYGCGYTDLPKVIEGLKKHGFRTGLWTEDGVDKIAWEVGTAGSRAQKLDVAWTGKGYQFALDANHDAAQGILDNSDNRPFLWTVMGWAGIQRYAVTWTGDQSGSWDYIRWHIPTLIGSGLSGQVYATGDVDGIFGGSPETFTRDLQWKSFTPVLMGMSGWSKTSRKHPWWFEEPYRSINRKYLKLKMRLTPYMYTLAREAEQKGSPIVRGLMWDFENDPNAHSEKYKNQFLLGKDLLIAPVYKSQTASKGWRQDIYLPDGVWIDYWDGTVTVADGHNTELDYPVTLDKLPILVRAGAIIPMYPPALYDGEVAKDKLTLDIYPHLDSHFTLYEDDGNTRKYQSGEFSEQRFSVTAPPTNQPGEITVAIEPVQGSYDSIENNRSYELLIHTRAKPTSISLNGQSLQSGWEYRAKDKYGTIQLNIPRGSIRSKHLVKVTVSDEFAQTKPYPKMPELGSKMSMNELKLISRPLEEPGYEYEKALDDDPSTWFRTSRDQSLNIGAQEFVLYLGDRTAISGFDITGRTDKWWKYGQLKDFEIYVSDIYGQWGNPAHIGQLKLTKEKQLVRFKPIVGSMLRFRAVSLHSPDESTEEIDTGAFNAFEPKKFGSWTVSEFALHNQQLSDKNKIKLTLSDHSWTHAEQVNKVIKVNKSINSTPMSMNGLSFKKGFGVFGDSQIDFKLSGNWQVFRADVGIDDSCNNQDGINFLVYGDGQLLFDSGNIVPPAVVKPELDIRSISHLSLRTVDKSNQGCGNWANPVVVGFNGDKILTE